MTPSLCLLAVGSCTLLLATLLLLLTLGCPGVNCYAAARRRPQQSRNLQPHQQQRQQQLPTQLDQHLAKLLLQHNHQRQLPHLDTLCIVLLAPGSRSAGSPSLSRQTSTFQSLSGVLLPRTQRSLNGMISGQRK